MSSSLNYKNKSIDAAITCTNVTEQEVKIIGKLYK